MFAIINTLHAYQTSPEDPSARLYLFKFVFCRSVAIINLFPSRANPFANFARSEFMRSGSVMKA